MWIWVVVFAAAALWGFIFLLLGYALRDRQYRQETRAAYEEWHGTDDA